MIRLLLAPFRLDLLLNLFVDPLNQLVSLEFLELSLVLTQDGTPQYFVSLQQPNVPDRPDWQAQRGVTQKPLVQKNSTRVVENCGFTKPVENCEFTKPQVVSGLTPVVTASMVQAGENCSSEDTESAGAMYTNTGEGDS